MAHPPDLFRRWRASCATDKSGKQVENCSCRVKTRNSTAKVVEDINDPLMHMVRNSVDHVSKPSRSGSRPAKRKSDGSPRLPPGRQHRVIEIADDGGGLKQVADSRWAVSQGIVGANESLTDVRFISLIFSRASRRQRRSPKSPVAASARTSSAATSRRFEAGTINREHAPAPAPRSPSSCR